MIKCPECNGFKLIGDLFGKVIIKCPLCNGTGKVKDKHKRWVLHGEILKQYRINRLHIGLREAARTYDIDASNLSKMERGIIKPKNIYGDIL